MSGFVVQLTAPNGRKYSQPIGLFINNKFVSSKSGERIATINPVLVLYAYELGKGEGMY
jgi:aldehyde dehydrogenase (NAD(P)+)